MGMVNAVIGIATLVGSILASVLPKPKSRVRVICNSLLFAMSFENFMLALGRTPLIWCIGGFLGWIAIPLMNTNLDVILRTRIPWKCRGEYILCVTPFSSSRYRLDISWEVSLWIGSLSR